jgi:RNA polymerase sigma-70 factor (ECF subfamily)
MKRNSGNERGSKAAQFSGREIEMQQTAACDRDGDGQLVARAQRGEKQAFARLFEKHQARIARLIMRLVRDAAEVEDLTQEVFIKAYLGLPAFRGDSAFYSWLYRIGINAAKNHLAASRRRVPTATRVDIEEAERFDDAVQLHDLCDPEHALRAGEIARTIECAATDLPPDLRAALDLCEVDSMSYQDIARCVGCPIGTVRSRIFRAREAIAARVRPMLESQSDRVW